MAGLWILVIFFLGIFFWSIIPAPNIENSYSVDFSRPLFQNQVCPIEDSFPTITLNAKHPAFLHFGSKATFEVLVIKENAYGLKHEDDCDFSLELLLDLRSISIEPNDRLIQPLVDDQDQLFVYELQAGALDGKQEGDLWVYLISTSPDVQSPNRTPLFVIPVEIEIRSLLGIPMLWLRLVSLPAIFLLIFQKVFGE